MKKSTHRFLQKDIIVPIIFQVYIIKPQNMPPLNPVRRKSVEIFIATCACFTPIRSPSDFRKIVHFENVVPIIFFSTSDESEIFIFLKWN